MLVAAAVCPHPPLLVPELAGDAGQVLAKVRAACLEAVHALVAVPADLMVLVGDAPTTGPLPPGTLASLAGFGVNVVVRPGPGPTRVPLSLTVGTWLLDQAGYRANRLAFGVSDDVSPERAATLGAVLGDREPRVAMLVLGDGAARREESSPGWADPRGVSFDETVSAALGAGDPEALSNLDPALARELWCSGRAAWQVLAGASGGMALTARSLLDEAPLGVGYHVATWLPAADRSPVAAEVAEPAEPAEVAEQS